MASKEEEFVIKLRQEVAGPAASARSAVGDLRAQMDATREAVGGLEAKLAESAGKLAAMSSGVEGQSSVSIGAIRRQQAAVAALQAQLSQKQGDLGALQAAQGLAVEADAMRATKVAAQQLAAAEQGVKSASGGVAAAGKQAGAGAVQGEQGIQAMLTAAQGAGGPMGGLIGRAKALVTGLGKGGLVGAVVAAAVAIVALTVAVIAAGIAFIKFALTQADAQRSQRLLTEGLAVSSKSLAGLGEILPKVQSATGLAGDEIRSLAQQLDAAGVSAANMPEALTALATATAGGASTEFIKRLNDGLKATGHVLPELQGQMEKLGEIAAQKSRSFESLQKRLASNVSGIFAGIKLDGLLKGLEKMVSLFDTTTASGKALKFLAETMLQPLIDKATAALPKIERLFLQGVVWALQLYINIKKTSRALDDLTGRKGFTNDTISSVFEMTAAFAAFLNPLGLLTAPIKLLDWMIEGIRELTGIKVPTISELFGGLFTGDLTPKGVDIGTSIIDGLTSGITSGAASVVSALTGVVGTAVGAAKSALGISSPSKVFAQIGLHTSAGMAEGVEAGAPEVNRSMTKMVDAPSEAAPGAVTSSSSKTINIDLRGCTFGEGVDESKLTAWLRRAFETETLTVEPA